MFLFKVIFDLIFDGGEIYQRGRVYQVRGIECMQIQKSIGLQSCKLMLFLESNWSKVSGKK